MEKLKESKRIEYLRAEIIKVIPKFPNTKETKKKLHEASLAELLLHYLSWMSRYVSIKPRKIIIEPSLTRDKRWAELKEQIENFLHKARTGENLTPHLSIQPHSKGYTPAAGEKGPDVDRWADKDFFLNAMGYHHFHLGTKIEPKGHVERTNEVLFAKVSRDTFSAIGIFGHSVFDSTVSEMSDERKRLWEIFDNHTTRSVPPGSVVVSSPIATSGHPLHIVETAQLYARIIRQADPKLDDTEYIQTLYRGGQLQQPTKSKFEWALNFSDLGVYEKNQDHFFIFHRGFN